jgi:prepilin-type N-terminal cleavage/methylation domain-containing protein
MNFNSLEKGQSLIELLVALAVFTIIIFGSAFFILDSLIAGRLSSELTVANFLAEEGLEVARSIRDNSWSDLIVGSHGLAISGGHWIFQGNEEDITSQLRSGRRTVLVESIDNDRKKVTSQIAWQFAEGRLEEIKLVSYLTNWQKGMEIRKPTASTDVSGRTTQDARAYDYPDGAIWSTTRYDYTENPSITFHAFELPTRTYTSLVLKYRYHADGASNDTYAVAYSTSGCGGTFIDLISPTSAGSPDTTVSVDLFPDQDLSQLCIKIYTQRVGARDFMRLYTRDIWTEGFY